MKTIQKQETEAILAMGRELEELRALARAVADKHIAPNAAEADEKSEFPQAAYDALVKSDLHALHVPEEFGGAGADAARGEPDQCGARRAAG